MARACRRKDSTFETSQVKSVFLYGKPNKVKLNLLSCMQQKFCELANENIRIICKTDGLLLQLVKNDKKDSAVRKLEKQSRPAGLNSAFCQAAFDYAFTRLSNRLNTIRKDMYAEDQTIFTQSKVLFAMSLMEQPKEEMSAVMKELANGKIGFYKDCADTLDSMDKDEFRFLMQEFMDSYAVHAMEYRIPHISRAEVPLDSRLMKIEESANIKAPYVISVTDPFNRNKRFAVPLNTSRHSLHKIKSNKMAGSVSVCIKNGKLHIGWAYTRSMKQPKTSVVRGVDTGITDVFHTSDGKAIGSMKPVLDFYHNTVEPSFAGLSDLRNKKRSVSHYLRHHKDLPEDVRRSLIQKMDRLDYMMQTMDAPYRKKRRYYGMLDREIHKSVTGYMDGLKRDTFTVIERLDIKEFKKSRKVNGMFSCFARGKTQEALMKALNWKGYDFVEVAPEFTSQVCPVCGNLDSANRDGKRFKCICCGHEDDADHVGNINIRERAVNKDLMDICEKHRYGNGLQNALKDYYMEQNEIFKKQHPQGMVS